mgnify:CR=1 FL=1
MREGGDTKVEFRIKKESIKFHRKFKRKEEEGNGKEENIISRIGRPI